MSLQQRSERELKKVVTPEDAPTALRLVIHDAATYDVASGQGGLNGSIVNRCPLCDINLALTLEAAFFQLVMCATEYISNICTASLVCSEELGREENKDLKSFVDKLAGVKKTIDDKGKTSGECCLLYSQCMTPVAGQTGA